MAMYTKIPKISLRPDGRWRGRVPDPDRQGRYINFVGDKQESVAMQIKDYSSMLREGLSSEDSLYLIRMSCKLKDKMPKIALTSYGLWRARVPDPDRPGKYLSFLGKCEEDVAAKLTAYFNECIAMRFDAVVARLSQTTSHGKC